MDRPYFSTAKGFNEASEEAEWGFKIEVIDGIWRLLDRNGDVKLSSKSESALANFAPFSMWVEEQIAKQS